MNQQQGSQSATQSGLSGAPNLPQGGGLTPNPNKRLLQAGANVGRIIELCDIGTQTQTFGGKTELKRKFRVGLEFPQLKQRYYMEDEHDRSCICSKEVSYSIADNSFLKKLIDVCEGQTLSVDNALALSADMSKYLGRLIVVEIGHKQSKNGNWYEKVLGMPMAFDETRFILPQPWNPERDLHWFFIDQDNNGNVIGNNFRSQAYANLPKYIKNDLDKSEEAKVYQQAGGTFAENQQNNQPQSYQQPQAHQQQPVQQQAAAPQQAQAPAQQAPQGDGKVWNAQRTAYLEMIDTAFSMQTYLQDPRWTPDLMVSNGKARWVEVQQQQPSAPSGPAGPGVQAPAGPQAPQQQAQPMQQRNLPPQQQSGIQASPQVGTQQSYEDNDDLPF